MANITFSTCFYPLHSKFDASIYQGWIENFISLLKSEMFNLVFYTNEEGFEYIKNIKNVENNLKIIIKPINQFYTYRYIKEWEKNHALNHLLNDRTEWTLNMLWSEKLWFVKETVDKKYFNTDMHGWCDVGYFRNRQNDSHTNTLLKKWPCPQKIKNLNPHQIHYAIVNLNMPYLSYLGQMISLNQPIPVDQTSIAGGFFMIHREKIDWWTNVYDNMLQTYFQKGWIVKDDQIIIIHCILLHQPRFCLHIEHTQLYDTWFMFQRLLEVNHISIVMPISSGVEYIKDSISSILSQTYENWEMIIGIYGYPKFGKVYQSVLNIVSSIDETQRKKITVIDLYPITSRSNALHDIITCYTSPQSSHIALLDVHDIWEPNKLEIQLPYLNHFDVVGTNKTNGYVIKKADTLQWKPNLENDRDDGDDNNDLLVHLKKEGKTFYLIETPLVRIQNKD